MPEIELPEKLHKVLTTEARLIVVIGGRSSGKSEGFGRIMLMKAQTECADILCGREYQNSIEDSVHKLFKNLIEELGVQGANVLDKKIDLIGGGGFRFKGFARNSAAVKSAQGFKYSWIEEAQDLSEKSLDDLLPTIRANNSKLFFTANPQASGDPFSQRFIVPFQKELDRDGFYEDDMHLIIVMNWRDNPWHGELEGQRLWDKENFSRAKYDHIWEGAFNDTVDDAIIKAEWFDACIDAHIKLGFKPQGAKIVAHDPSDLGGDSKGLVYRHGSVILDVREKTTGDVNEGCDWATDYAIKVQADGFIWDGDGLGVSLKRQVAQALQGKRIEYQMFKGSESPDRPDALYQPDARELDKKSRTNRETFRNKRAQYYIKLRDRMYNTYLAIVKKQYINPDDLLSISSEVSCLQQLRSEVCRIPLKQNGNGYIQIMSKVDMRTKMKLASPNLSDSAMMVLDVPMVNAVIDHSEIFIPDIVRI